MKKVKPKGMLKPCTGPQRNNWAGSSREGELVAKPRDIANIQVKAFHDKLERLKQCLPDTDDDPVGHLRAAMREWSEAGNRPELDLRYVTLVETAEAIKLMNNSPAQGHDLLDK